MIKAEPASELKEFAVIDVRDDDFVVRPSCSIGFRRSSASGKAEQVE